MSKETVNGNVSDLSRTFRLDNKNFHVISTLTTVT